MKWLCLITYDKHDITAYTNKSGRSLVLIQLIDKLESILIQSSILIT